MNRKQFIETVGHPPEKDDLERANCKRAGSPGHMQCGICTYCGKPNLVCAWLCKGAKDERERDSQDYLRGVVSILVDQAKEKYKRGGAF